MAKLDLNWEVELRFAGMYYKGRGNSPENALRDLNNCLNTGIQEVTESLEVHQRRKDALEEKIKEIANEET